MRKFQAPIRAQRSEEFWPPKFNNCCGYAGCGNETQVAVAMFERIADGRRICGAFYDFATDKGPRDGLRFVEFITRCGSHFLQDLDRSRRSVWAGVAASGVPTVEEIRALRVPQRSKEPGAEGDSGWTRKEGEDMGRDSIRGAGSSGDDREGEIPWDSDSESEMEG